MNSYSIFDPNGYNHIGLEIFDKNKNKIWKTKKMDSEIIIENTYDAMNYIYQQTKYEEKEEGGSKQENTDVFKKKINRIIFLNDDIISFKKENQINRHEDKTNLQNTESALRSHIDLMYLTAKELLLNENSNLKDFLLNEMKSVKVDKEGTIKEIMIFKKSLHIVEKHIEYLVNQINRLKEG